MIHFSARPISSPPLLFSGTVVLTDWIKQQGPPPDSFQKLVETIYTGSPAKSDTGTANQVSITTIRVQSKKESLGFLRAIRNELARLESRIAHKPKPVKKAALLAYGDVKRVSKDLLKTVRAVEGVLKNAANAAQQDQAILLLNPAITALEDLLKKGVQIPGKENRYPISRDFRGPLDRTLSILKQVRDHQGNLKALSDTCLMMADNVIRDRVYFMPPFALERAMMRNWGDKVADLVVVGAGPAGLSTALHSVDAGLKTIICEGGYVAQSFSNQLMQPVHVMRTNALLSSMTRQGASPDALHQEYAMAKFLDTLRRKSVQAFHGILEMTGRTIIGNPPDITQVGKVDVPVARNELFQYFEQIADTIASHKKGIILEQSPVSSIKRIRKGLFEVMTRQGHKFYAKNVVMANGQVGMEGQYIRSARPLVDLVSHDQKHYLPLSNRSDLVSANTRLEKLIKGIRSGKPSKIQPIIADPLLGSPQMNELIRALPPNTRCAVVGGGESGAKGLVELFNINPDLMADWFVEKIPKGIQFQVPTYNTSPDYMQDCIADPAKASQSIEEWRKDFGVPITPQTLSDLTALASSGRVRIFELGKKFTEQTVELQPYAQGKAFGTEIMVRDPEIIRELLKKSPEQVANLRAEKSKLLLSQVNGVIVSAIGYDRKAMREQDPLFQDLLNQGLVQLVGGDSSFRNNEVVLGEDGISSALDPNFYFIGSANYGMAADSAIFSMPVRANRIVETIHQRLDHNCPVTEV
jgi:hypothetical protein